MRLPAEEASYWRSSSDKTSYPKLDEDLETDVVVVGGGICGLTTAYLLQQSGLKVAVLEKDTIGSGTTGHTTGKVTSQHNLFYAELQQHLGERHARIYGQANQTAVEEIEEVIKKEKISCDWQRADNFVFTANSGQITKFKTEAKLAGKLGLLASFETALDLPFSIKAAVKFSNQAKMNAQKYINGLAAAITNGSGRIFESSRAISIRDGQPAIIRTKKAQIAAKDIVVATNVPTFPLLARGAYCILEYPHNSYIVAGRPKRQLTGMYISPDEEHYSILPINSNRGPLLLIGGENHIPGLGGGARRHYQKLAEYAKSEFGVTSIKYHWKARDYMAYDDPPLIGKVYPWSEHLYTATAFRKWGLTNTMVAAMILRDLIVDQKNPWAETFNSLRISPITSIPRTITKSFT